MLTEHFHCLKTRHFHLAIGTIKYVFLIDIDPGHLAPLFAELIALPRQFFFLIKMRFLFLQPLIA